MFDAKTIAVTKLYRDCLKLADYLAFKQGHPSNILRDQVKRAFRKNQHEKDKDKIVQYKQDAINGLANYMFHESQNMAKPHCGTRPPPAPTGCLIPRVSFVCSTTRRHACRLPGQHRTAGFVCNAVPVKQQGGSDTEEEGGKAGGGGGGKTRNSIQKRKNTKSKGDMKSKGENQAVKHGQRDEEPEEEVVSQQQAAQWDSLAASLVQRANEMAMESDIEGTSWNDVLDLDYTLDDDQDTDYTDEDSVTSQQNANSTSTQSRTPRRRKTPKQVPMEALPKVAIVGRPNVGKSALFNRVTKTTKAIVYDYPGVTRDRLYTRAFWGDREFVVVDTGGLVSDADALARGEVVREPLTSAGQLPLAIERQAAAAIEESHAIIMVVDGQTGLTGADEEVITWLRRHYPDKPTTLAVNKCENSSKADIMTAEFWTTGLEPIAVSAISGSGTGDMMDHMVRRLPHLDKNVEEEEEQQVLSIAIVGRPNVGKSSLLNALCGEERAIVSSVSGTTRDAIDTDLELEDGTKLKLVDTAGIRRRTAVAASKDGAESLSVDRSFKAIRRADVAVLVLDALDGVTQQDFRLAEVIAAEGKACVLVINKWDAVRDKQTGTLNEYKDDVLAQLRPVSWANIVFTSAKTGQRVPKVLEAVLAAGDNHRHRVTTATLNLVMQEATAWRAPPTDRGSGKKGRIYYATQAAIRPPSFVLFVNDPRLFTEDYRRFLERQLRGDVGFPGTPIRLFLRGKPPSAKERQPPSNSR